MLKSGLVSISFRKFDVQKILGMCQKAQLECIEWGGDVHVPHGGIAKAQEVKKMSADAGIEIASYGSYYFAGYSENSTEEPVSFQAVMDSATALGTATIRVWAGKISKSSEISDGQRQEIIDDLVRTGRMAAKHDVKLGLELHGGTLTDTNESAIKLKNELPADSNVYFYWQPGIGFSDEECLGGIKALAPGILNIHVFQWTSGQNGYSRHLLRNGKARWINFLTEIAEDGKDHTAMLEFICDDSEENFYKDAVTLKQITEAANKG